MTWTWLRSLNPFLLFLDYRRSRDAQDDRRRELDRLDRMEDRETFRHTVLTMAGMVEKAFDATRAQSEVFKEFLDSYRIAEPPRLREYDEEEEVQRYLDKKGGGIPPELAGLSKLDQFDALLNRLDS